MKYVIILHRYFRDKTVKPYFRDKVVGPFDTEAQARTYAVNHFGWPLSGNERLWEILLLRSLEEFEK